MKKILICIMLAAVMLFTAACADNNDMSLKAIDKRTESVQLTENADGSGRISCFDAQGREFCIKKLDEKGEVENYLVMVTK